MLDSVKIARRQSEIRQTLAGIVGKETPSEDETRQMEAFDAEYRSNETRYRAALIAEDEERREAGAELETRSDRDWSEMMGQFEMRQVALALDEGRRSKARQRKSSPSCGAQAASGAYRCRGTCLSVGPVRPSRAERLIRSRPVRSSIGCSRNRRRAEWARR